MKKMILTMFSVLVLAGCRTAKPTATSESKEEALSVSAESTISQRHDSVSISDEVAIRGDNKIEFVEGGGAIYVSVDGSVAFSGVSGVRSSRSVFSENTQTKESFSVRTKSMDSIAVARKSTAFSESKPTVASAKWGWKMICIMVALALLFILLMIPKIKRIFNL